MSISLNIIISLVIVVLVSLYFGYQGKAKNNSVKYFFWGGNNLSNRQLTRLIISTSFSFNAILYHTWLGYEIGWSAILIQLLWVISFILVRNYSKEIISLKQYGTMHGSIEHFFGRNAGILSAFASIIGFALLIGWEVTVVTKVLTGNVSNNIPIYSYLLALFVSGIVSIYTIKGGIRGNLNANTIQNIIAILALIILMVFLFVENEGAIFHGVSSVPKLWGILGVGGLITNVIFSLVWQFVDMSNWQNIASSSSVKEVRKGLLSSAFWVLVFPGVIGTGMGIAMTNIEGLTENTILDSVISIVNQHPYLLILSLIGFFAVMFSTLDGYLLSAAQSFSWDIFHKSKINKVIDETIDEKSEDNIMKSIYYIIFLVAIIGGLGTLFIHMEYGIQLFHLVYIVTVSHLALFPSVIILLIKKKRNNNIPFNGFSSILAGLLVGFGLVAFSIIYDHPVALTWSATVGLILAFIVGYIVGLLKQEK